ncbi:MAG: hypothetical protein AAFV53_03560 [Myxococcota bacterium]
MSPELLVALRRLVRAGDPITTERIAQHLHRASPRQRQHLALLGALTDPQIQRFLHADLPRLSRQLRRRRQRVRQPTSGAVRGRIDWPQSVRYRASRHRAAGFVCHVPTAGYDLPENRLLVWWIHGLVCACAQVDHDLRQGWLVNLMQDQRAKALAEAWSELAAPVFRWDNDPRFQTMKPVLTLQRAALEAAYATRMPEYAALADAAKRWDALTRATPPIPPSHAMIPLNANDPFWLQLAALQLLRADDRPSPLQPFTEPIV